MREIDSAVENMIDAILNSEEYKEYHKQLALVKQYPELKEQIDEFRTRNYLLQSSDDNAFDKLEQFEREYSAFRENSLVSDFLAAELAVCRMIQGINNRVTEALHFE